MVKLGVFNLGITLLKLQCVVEIEFSGNSYFEQTIQSEKLNGFFRFLV